ncbi:MAG: hypothetical protein HY899_09100 [Deltaproteobacteria bacterium]|nr:hypothetical protein [Deltaproteobacteria bacterium]
MPLPVALIIDVEPDPRLFDRPEVSHWQGFHRMLELVARLRQQLRDLQQQPPSFAWLLRMDPQMRIVYGDGGWIAENFAKELAGLREAGDELGLHTHLYRQLADGHTWITDTADPAWRRQCVLEATDTWRRIFGEPCLVHSFGDRSLYEDSLDVLEEAGIRVDLTPEPGLVSKSVYRPDEKLVGKLPDYSRAPRELWRPARGDFLRHDPLAGRDLWLLPVATYRFPRYFEPGRRIDQVLRRARGDLPSRDDISQRYVRICLAQRGYVVRRGCALLMRQHAPNTLHFVLRCSQANSRATCERVADNVRWLAGGGLGRDIEFVSPLRLMDRLGVPRPCNPRTDAAVA